MDIRLYSLRLLMHLSVTWNVVFRRVRRVVQSVYYLRHVCLSVRPPVRVEKFGSHWRDFRKSVKKTHDLLKSDKNSEQLALFSYPD
jgi:hypothetical protein